MFVPAEKNRLICSSLKIICSEKNRSILQYDPSKMGWRESCEHLLHYLGALPCCSRCPRLYLYPTGVISCEQMNFRHVGLQGSCKENMKQQNLPAETYIAEVVGPKLV